jgi:hypothetical protein
MDDILKQALDLERESNTRLEAKLTEANNKLLEAQNQLTLLRNQHDTYVKGVLIRDSFLDNGGLKEAADMTTKLLADKFTVEDGKLVGEQPIADVLSQMKNSPLTAASFLPSNPNIGSGSNPDSSDRTEKISVANKLMGEIKDPILRVTRARELGVANIK